MLKHLIKKHKGIPPKKNNSKNNYKPKQSEVNTMVIEAIKTIKRNKSKDKNKVQEELNAFEGITLSDSDKTVNSNDS